MALINKLNIAFIVLALVSCNEALGNPSDPPTQEEVPSLSKTQRLDVALSEAGAIGIMQLLPSTAADANIGIPDISQAESNIHAGVKYLDFIRNRYFSDSGMDAFSQTLFAFAAYNAGPARVQKLRDMAAEQGYDPNVWFGNVEVMAAADIGAETVQYVANILKYYVAYRIALLRVNERKEVREGAGIE